MTGTTTLSSISIEPSTARSAAVLLGFALTVKDLTSILCFLLGRPSSPLSFIVVGKPSPRLAAIAVDSSTAAVIPDNLWVYMTSVSYPIDVICYELG
jgi:hypothetical protein